MAAAKYVRVFDSLESLVAHADAGYRAGKIAPSVASCVDRSPFIGRPFQSWDDIRAAVHAEWQEGLDVFQWMIHELSRESLPVPRSAVRRARWSEDTGDDVDNDRLRSGQPFWRRMARESHHCPRTITIIADLSTLGHVPSADISGVAPSQSFSPTCWRSRETAWSCGQ